MTSDLHRKLEAKIGELERDDPPHHLGCMIFDEDSACDCDYPARHAAGIAEDRDMLALAADLDQAADVLVKPWADGLRHNANRIRASLARRHGIEVE